MQDLHYIGSARIVGLIQGKISGSLGILAHG